MIISYLHRFIFIKTKKTAGSSMEIALATHAGAEDIVTPLGVGEELERHRITPAVLPRNFSSDKASEGAFLAALRRDDREGMQAAYREGIRGSGSLAVQRHGGAASALKIAGQEFWNSAYKFSIERHPYEKAVSLAWYQRRRRDFAQSLEEVLEDQVYRNFDLYTIEGRPVLDFVLCYERLAQEIPRVEKALGLCILSRLPRANARKRKDPRPAHELLTAKQKAIIQEVCREEFEMFGYQR